jgi:hypothetical protein
MRQLSCLVWDVPWDHLTHGQSLAQLFGKALPSLPQLKILFVDEWPCQMTAAWQELPVSIARVPTLTRLEI